MSAGMTTVIVIAVVVVLAAAAFAVKAQLRRRHLRERFGPEYDRTVQERSRSAAEKELAEREKRHSQLDIRPLDPATRERYAQQWAMVQERFVDQPGPSVDEADRLVTALMAERGYPTEGDHEERVAHLSVEHSATLGHYRSAHDIKTRHDSAPVTTEELREAMVHYRDLFEDLLDAGREDTAESGHTRRTAAPRR